MTSLVAECSIPCIPARGPPRLSAERSAPHAAEPRLTMRQYFQTDLEADRQVANALAELIIGGSLASTAATASLANHMQKALSLFEKGPLALVAGEGFEPSTSGL